MKTEVSEIREALIDILHKHRKLLKVTSDTPEKYEVHGTVDAMQGKKKVDGIYFSSVVPKAKDCRFYFFPTYTHAEQLRKNMDPDLEKCLKGKSCFHIKKIDASLQQSLEDLVSKAVDLYKNDGLL